MVRRENETVNEYLERLEMEFDRCSKNLDRIIDEMEEKGIAICNKCGCSIYKHKTHKCE